MLTLPDSATARVNASFRARFWAQVTAFGALWGVFEITVGSFLHTMRLPLAGVVLAGLSAALLVAQRQIYPFRGSSIATGIVAALCKSLSPGGVILGPMVGITVEAALVELSLLIAPRSLLGAFFAGALAALWAASQGLLTKLLYFGLQLLEIYVILLRQAASLLGLSPEAGWVVVALFAGVVMAIGASFGLLGRLVGRRAQQHDGADITTADSEMPERARPAEAVSACNHRALLALLALACIGLQFGGQLYWTGLSLAIWLTALALYDRTALNRLWKPRFWVITIVLALLAGLLVGKKDLVLGPLSLSLFGLLAGVKMVLRGAFVFGLASWASRAVGQRDIETFFRRLSLPAMGVAIPTAIRLLPELEKRLLESWEALATTQASSLDKQKKRRGFLALRPSSMTATLVQVVAQAAALAEEMAHQQAARDLGVDGPRDRLVLAIGGARGSGKTTLLEQLAARLEERAATVAGIVQRAAERDEAGRASRYELVDLKSGESRVVARRKKPTGYDFDDAAFFWAASCIADARQSADILLVDELGWLEAEGGGHLAALTVDVSNERARIWVASVREDVADKLEQKLGRFDHRFMLGQDAASSKAALCEALVLVIESHLGDSRPGYG